MARYPVDSVQYYAEPWWEPSNTNTITIGRLVWVFALHMDQVPMRLVSEGRLSATDHHNLKYRLEPFIASTYRPPNPPIPVAALPEYADENRVVSRGKRRPALVLSTPCVPIAANLTTGGGKWQSSQTITVAPFYGCTKTDTRAGFSTAFVDRIRRGMYPHLMWDRLPFEAIEESIMMFSQVQSVGVHQQTINATPWQMNADALDVVLDWWRWFQTSHIDSDSILGMSRESCLNSVKDSKNT